MGVYIEFVDQLPDKSCQERLYGFLEKQPQNDDEEEKKEWSRRNEEFQTYLKSNVRTANTQYGEKGRVERRLNYDSLSDILRIWNLNGKSALEVMGITVDWPSAEFQEISSLCEGLDGQTIMQIANSAIAISSHWWRLPELEKAQPSVRATALFRTKIPFSEQRMAPEPLLKAANDRSGSTGIPISGFNEIASYLQVSLHWLLRFAPDVALYCSEAKADVVLDAFSFMPAATKEIFMDALRSYRKGDCQNA